MKAITQEQIDKMMKYCSHCGKETWACSCGGHCYHTAEHEAWKQKFSQESAE